MARGQTRAGGLYFGRGCYLLPTASAHMKAHTASSMNATTIAADYILKSSQYMASLNPINKIKAITNNLMAYPLLNQ